MKQELTAFIWPALVGVLAAALILDKWVLEPQETGNAPVNGGYRDAVALPPLGGQHLHRQIG